MFGIRFPRCAECGLPMLRDPVRRRYDCHACGIHVPYAPARGNARSAGAGARRGDATGFDQRGLHRVVVECARQEFLRGNYLGAVYRAYVGLEGLVRAKSGIGEQGAALMARALGRNGILEAGPAGLAGVARDHSQDALESMCVGMVSSVRNRICHEPKASLHIGRKGALHMLGAISNLCEQVEQTRRRSGRGRRVRRAGGVRCRPPLPKSGGGQSVRKAGARAADADCDWPSRGRGGRAPQRRTLLGLPWLQAVETLVRIAAGTATVIKALAEIFR